MIHAKFKLGFMTIDCTGETPSEAFLSIQRHQDLTCLVSQAMMFGEKKKGTKLMKEYYEPAQNGNLTLEQLRTLDIRFAPGTLKCLEAVENDD